MNWYKTCTVRFDEEEQKWYGWSHRAKAGFGIGDTPSAPTPDGNETKYKGPAKTLEEAKLYAEEFSEAVG